MDWNQNQRRMSNRRGSRCDLGEIWKTTGKNDFMLHRSWNYQFSSQNTPQKHCRSRIWWFPLVYQRHYSVILRFCQLIFLLAMLLPEHFKVHTTGPLQRIRFILSHFLFRVFYIRQCFLTPGLYFYRFFGVRMQITSVTSSGLANAIRDAPSTLSVDSVRYTQTRKASWRVFRICWLVGHS